MQYICLVLLAAFLTVSGLVFPFGFLRCVPLFPQDEGRRKGHSNHVHFPPNKPEKKGIFFPFSFPSFWEAVRGITSANKTEGGKSLRWLRAKRAIGGDFFCWWVGWREASWKEKKTPPKNIRRRLISSSSFPYFGERMPSLMRRLRKWTASFDALEFWHFQLVSSLYELVKAIYFFLSGQWAVF